MEHGQIKSAEDSVDLKKILFSMALQGLNDIFQLTTCNVVHAEGFRNRMCKYIKSTIAMLYFLFPARSFSQQ